MGGSRTSDDPSVRTRFRNRSVQIDPAAYLRQFAPKHIDTRLPARHNTHQLRLGEPCKRHGMQSAEPAQSHHADSHRLKWFWHDPPSLAASASSPPLRDVQLK